MSITIDPALAHFIAEYQKKHQIANRSEVVEEAIKSLRQLIEEYKASILEWESDAKEADLWDKSVADGLDHETW